MKNMSPHDLIIPIFRIKSQHWHVQKTHSHSVLVHIVFLSLSVYITDQSPKERCLRQWSIFLSAPLSYIHPHCTYLAGFIFTAIWWILVEKLRNASENHQLWLFTAAVNQIWYIYKMRGSDKQTYATKCHCAYKSLIFTCYFTLFYHHLLTYMSEFCVNVLMARIKILSLHFNETL